MQPVAVLDVHRARGRERSNITNWAECFFCQLSENNIATRQASHEGVLKILAVAKDRLKYNDGNNVNILDRLASIDLIGEISRVLWHHKCYSSFTNVDHIRRMKSRHEVSLSKVEEEYEVNLRLTRSVLPSVDWGICVFCQTKSTEKLKNVQFLETSEKILNVAKTDQTIHCRLSGVHDLIAVKCKYHLKCYVTFIRRNCKNEFSDVKANIEFSFKTIMVDIQKRLASGEILALNDVWQQYKEVLNEMDIDAGPYRNNTFGTKVKEYLASQVEIVKPLNSKESSLLFPSRDLTFTSILNQQPNQTEHNISTEPGTSMSGVDAEFLTNLYLVSLRIHNDLNTSPGHDVIGGLTSAAAEDVVPPNLYLLLRLLCCGNEDNTAENPDIRNKLLSIAQDIVFLTSRGHKKTPKHIGLAMTVHQATRSKTLVNLLHGAGHCVSYETVRRIDTAIAEDVLKCYESKGNVMVSSNFLSLPSLKGYLKFSNDNFDMLEETLSGKGTLHVSQVVAFRRKIEGETVTNITLPMSYKKEDRSITGKCCYQTLLLSTIGKQKPEPVFQKEVNIEMFSSEVKCTQNAKAQDLSWILARQEDSMVVPAWTGFNQCSSLCDAATSVIGPLPLLDAVAHDFDTIWTVMCNCMAMSKLLGEKYCVITYDEQLYSKAKQLQWHYKEECKHLVVMMGGFHIQLNFGKAIGQHMSHSGLKDVWTESNVFGENVSENILRGKQWNRLIRAHKLTLEALWSILWPKFLQWADENHYIIDPDIFNLAKKIVEALKEDNKELLQNSIKLQNPLLVSLLHLINEFDLNQEENPTFIYWRQYMDMISILMRFTRAIRDGDWTLYVSSFAEMLPWFSLYDHRNYTRWGSIFLADMRMLETTAPEVHTGFMDGDFVVKETKRKFNQIPDDQALEHVNKIAKISGGLVGISQNESARQKWGLTFIFRASLAKDTYEMFGMELDDGEYSLPVECGPSRMKKDFAHMLAIKTVLERFHVFRCFPNEDLICLSTGDVAREDIKLALLDAPVKGLKLITNFVNCRLVEKTLSFHLAIPNNNVLTFESLHKVVVNRDKVKQTIVKADRNLLRRVIVALEGGRDVQIGEILSRELFSVPLSLANSNGTLRPANKAQLTKILVKGEGVCHEQLPMSELRTCCIIDAMGLVQAIGKPQHAESFGDVANYFINSILATLKAPCTRTDVIFDRYDDISVKSGTRDHRTSGSMGIKRNITDRTTKLPDNWRKYMTRVDNKRILSNFLATELAKVESQGGLEIVVAGGFQNHEDVVQSNVRQDMKNLYSSQEEADTRIILHASDAAACGFDRLVINCRDTDVLVLLVSMPHILPTECWMRSGTANKRRFVAIHNIHLKDEIRNGLIPFHAITGSDTTSQLVGITKVKAWKVLQEHAPLLYQFGQENAIDNNCIEHIESFICRLYDPLTSSTSIVDVRCSLFRKSEKDFEKLPPTKDALAQHIKRAFYQAHIWWKSLEPTPTIPSYTDCGWTVKNERVIPVLMTQDPVSSKVLELVSCGCKNENNHCRTRQCACMKANMPCIAACQCGDWCQNCS